MLASLVNMRCWIHGVTADTAEVNPSFNFRNTEFSLGVYPLTNTVCFESLVVYIQASYIWIEVQQNGRQIYLSSKYIVQDVWVKPNNYKNAVRYLNAKNLCYRWAPDVNWQCGEWKLL